MRRSAPARVDDARRDGLERDARADVVTGLETEYELAGCREGAEVIVDAGIRIRNDEVGGAG